MRFKNYQQFPFLASKLASELDQLKQTWNHQVKHHHHLMAQLARRNREGDFSAAPFQAWMTQKGRCSFFLVLMFTEGHKNISKLYDQFLNRKEQWINKSSITMSHHQTKQTKWRINNRSLRRLADKIPSWVHPNYICSLSINSSQNFSQTCKCWDMHHMRLN